MNTQTDPTNKEKVLNLFLQAELYASFVLEHLVLESSNAAPVDPDLARDAFEYQGFARFLDGTPQMALWLNRSAHEIHFLFPNLTDKERSLLQKIHLESHNVRIHRRDAKDTDFPEFERDSHAAKAEQSKNELLQRWRDPDWDKLEQKLTALQMELLTTDYFDPDSNVRALLIM